MKELLKKIIDAISVSTEPVRAQSNLKENKVFSSSPPAYRLGALVRPPKTECARDLHVQ